MSAAAACLSPAMLSRLVRQGLAKKVEKSRKQLKEKKNRTRKIRGVKKVRAGVEAAALYQQILLSRPAWGCGSTQHQQHYQQQHYQRWHSQSHTGSWGVGSHYGLLNPFYVVRQLAVLQLSSAGAAGAVAWAGRHIVWSAPVWMLQNSAVCKCSGAVGSRS